ncbi:MAG: transcription antitermination factor NusB [Gammaproteobacteria bacterium]|nr:transcription antitermination factor NusB [Gammaproteobacteria bacterium]
MNEKKSSRAGRSRARKLLMQALYQSLLNEQSIAEVRDEFFNDQQLDNADLEFFDALVAEVGKNRGHFDELIQRFADRPMEQIDPVECSVLYAAMAELSARMDVPFRVVISESVTLAKKYGGTEGHRYVNAILDRAAAELRPDETARS